MELKTHYQSLFESSLEKVKHDQYEIDQQIDNPADRRRGITLLTRPDEQTKAQIRLFLNELFAIEPRQYYYPDTDLHITVMSIISCYKGFQLETISPKDYIEIIQKSIDPISSFNICFKGITLSPAGILVQGFPEGVNLQTLRDRLRKNFKTTNLQQSLDRRYTLQTAHSTVMRFKQPLRQKKKLLQCIMTNRNRNFGTFSVRQLELVYNDWYQREVNVQRLHHFNLPNQQQT